jgi:hypothetical protein
MGHLGINICCCNSCHGSAVEGIWALQDNYDGVFTTFDIPVILDGQFTGKFHTVLFWRFHLT